MCTYVAEFKCKLFLAQKKSLFKANPLHYAVHLETIIYKCTGEISMKQFLSARKRVV